MFSDHQYFDDSVSSILVPLFMILIVELQTDYELLPALFNALYGIFSSDSHAGSLQRILKVPKLDGYSLYRCFFNHSFRFHDQLYYPTEYCFFLGTGTITCNSVD